MDPPGTVIEVAVEPKIKADQAKIVVALNRLAQEDLSFQVTSDVESGQTVIKGMSEHHLETLVTRMKREFKLDINVGQPQVAYRETITRRAEIDYTHKKQTGSFWEFARVKFIFEPSEPGEGIVFESKVIDDSVPQEFIPGIERAIVKSAETGVLVGFPMIDVRATLVDGTSHEGESPVPAFEIASRAAFREGIAKATPKLLEPIMRVEIVTPEDCLNDIIDDMKSRRGNVTGMDARANTQVIKVRVPLSNMFGYVSNLRAMSQGRAQFTMVFDRYEIVPDRDPDPDPSSAPAIAKRA